MCRKPIPPTSDEGRHHQNRQVVEYAGEPIHHDCHPTNASDSDTNHVEVHEHLLQAHQELSAATDECADPDSELGTAWNSMEIQVKIKALADEYKEKHL